MMPLRAYANVMVESKSGWQVCVCVILMPSRPFGRTVKIVTERPAFYTSVFGQPCSARFEDLARQWPGRMLVTASCEVRPSERFREQRFGPRCRRDARNPHLATKGWDYSVSDL